MITTTWFSAYVTETSPGQDTDDMSLPFSESRDKPVIFVVGTSRSGKTLISQILGNSPLVFWFRELHFFERLYQPGRPTTRLSESAAAELYAKLLQIQDKGILNLSQSSEYQAEAARCVARLRLTNCSAVDVYRSFLHDYATSRKPGAIPCEQTGNNVFYIDELLSSFPGARVINMIRDPRDVLASKKKKWQISKNVGSRIPLRELLRQSVQYHPYTVSKLWVANVRAAGKHGNNPAVHSLRFEDLIDDPEHHVRIVCEFVGIECRDTMLRLADGLDLAKKPEELKTHSASDLVSPTELYICQTVTAGELGEFGYPINSIVPKPLTLAWYWMLLPIKLAFALIVNIRRIGSIKSSVMRRLRS
jgi:hypothetical protein